MAIAFLIYLERDVPGTDAGRFGGRALGAARWELETILTDLDRPGLGRFISFSRDEAETLATDMKFDLPGPGHAEHWFSSREGLENVRALRDYVRDHPAEVSECRAVLAELEEMERLLDAADRAGVGFRLSVDY